jgi:hypothetical protein
MPVGSSRPLQSHRFSVGQATTNRNTFDLPINTSFLEDGDYSSLNGLDLKSPIAKTFAALEGDDTFPTLTSDGLKVSPPFHLNLTSVVDHFPALCQLSGS